MASEDRTRTENREAEAQTQDTGEQEQGEPERAPRNTGTEGLLLEVVTNARENLQNQKGARWNAGILEYFGIFWNI